MNAPKLREVSIEVCHECPLSCVMCSSSAEYPEPVKNRLTLDEIKSILRDAKACGGNTVSISGGEPLQRPDIDKILSYAYINDYHVLFYTTGIMRNSDNLTTVDDKFLYKLYKIGATVIFDLQSHDAKTHDNIMQVPGSFDMTVDAIKRCLKNGLTTETHFVPQKDNFKHIEDYVYWLNDLGVHKVSFLRLVPQGRAKENDVMITKNQFKHIQELFYDLRHRNDLKIKIRLGHPINFQFLLDPEEPVDSCRGGTDAPLITPWGSVHTCPAWKQLEHYSAGNIRKQPLKEIWLGSPVYKTFRWFIHGKGYLNMNTDSKCVNCEFFHGCKGKCVAQRLIAYSDGRPLEEAILLGSDPMCWHEP